MSVVFEVGVTNADAFPSRQGQLKIAHRFNGGTRDAMTRRVPIGTKEVSNETR